MCGETEEKLSQELIQFEFQIERDVVEPLYVLAEVSRRRLMHQLRHNTWLLSLTSVRNCHFPTSSVFNRKFALGIFNPSLFLKVDIPNIQKQRKHLAKLVLDMDSARTR